MQPYQWRCVACEASNPPELDNCAQCACPAIASTSTAEKYQPKQPAEPRISLDTKTGSPFARWYYISMALYTTSLLFNGLAGVKMLLLGWILVPAGHLGWLANPAMLYAFLAIGASRRPRTGRWAALMSPIFMLCSIEYFRQSMGYWLWLASAIVLCIAILTHKKPSLPTTASGS